jgi:acyl-coenzyme A synthetase/AMP-(fatty) acid ligase
MTLSPLSVTVQRLTREREAWFWSPDVAFARSTIGGQPWFEPMRAALRGRNVLIRTTDQLRAALALIALDGVVRRMVICPPDLKDDLLPAVIEDTEAEAAVMDGEAPSGLAIEWMQPRVQPQPEAHLTEWVMFTSGTSGRPKMVRHTLAGLTGAIKPSPPGAPTPTWATFYDIRRYGGLQILLRALLGNASLILSDPHEPVADHLKRLGARGVTHISGTPSHWRRALMAAEIGAMAPAYVRLSGEIADNAVLGALQAAFPAAAVGHAYASTEAGVGFEVTDRKEGFPASLIGAHGAVVEMKVEDGSLRIRSPMAAEAYVGEGLPPLHEPDGFIDTGDMLERRGDRFYFVGRRGGIINVGGLKIHPEEVEAVINAHPAVRMSRVMGRRNPITGAIVVAEVVLADPGRIDDQAALKLDIMDHCRAALPPFKRPASVRVVDHLPVTAGGKLERPIA